MEDRMPADLFRSAPPRPVSRARAWLLPLSIAAHVAAILALVIAPLLADAQLPDPVRPGVVDYVRVELPRAPRVPLRAAPAHPTTAPVATGRRSAPLEPPSTIAFESPIEPALDGEPLGDPGADLVTRAPFGDPEGIALPPPEPARRNRVRVGGRIDPPRKTRDVTPVYPPLAQAARVEGLVILEAEIGAEGRVEHVRVLRSAPLLDQAAIDAVSRWEFEPTRLNGEAIPVVMTVTVDFRLR
jgi:periplasmic protein TonB